MNNANVIKLEVGRVLSAASTVFGYEASLADLGREASRRNAGKESREEIEYLAAAIANPDLADLGVVVNISDNLCEKLEFNRFSKVLGFSWIEDLAGDFTEPSKKLIGWTMATLCTFVAGGIVFNVGFSKLPMIEFFVFAASLALLVGTASIAAAWASSIDFTNGQKKWAVLLGYGYASAYVYALYRCGLRGFNFDYPVFGGEWLIVWMAIAPVAFPLLMLFWKSLPNDDRKSKARNSGGSSDGDLYYNSHNEEMGKVGLGLDPTIGSD